MNDIKDFTLEELKHKLADLGEKSFRAEQIYKWLYQDKVTSFDEMTNLSLELRQKLKENFTFTSFEIASKLVSKDGTTKYLFKLNDGNAIETVLMKYNFGNSVCVSSQIGCKMGCKFCASTGIQFVRSLTPGEILTEILQIEQDLQLRISNVVFMGIGEPFDNFDNIIKTISILNEPKGLAIGARHISVSTSGIVPNIYKFADLDIQCTLSISLHSPDDKIRSSMMPVNDAYNINELMTACKYYMDKTNKRISFEYALSKGYNDSKEDANKLIELFNKYFKGNYNLIHVNLIPINKIENGKYEKPDVSSIMKFRDHLNDRGITATIRRELGDDIQAACGQLRRQNLNKWKIAYCIVKGYKR